jgi:hypothetical protein
MTKLNFINDFSYILLYYDDQINPIQD